MRHVWNVIIHIIFSSSCPLAPPHLHSSLSLLPPIPHPPSAFSYFSVSSLISPLSLSLFSSLHIRWVSTLTHQHCCQGQHIPAWPRRRRQSPSTSQSPPKPSSIPPRSVPLPHLSTCADLLTCCLCGQANSVCRAAG